MTTEEERRVYAHLRNAVRNGELEPPPMRIPRFLITVVMRLAAPTVPNADIKFAVNCIMVVQDEFDIMLKEDAARVLDNAGSRLRSDEGSAQTVRLAPVAGTSLESRE